jgi:hypothetical protein
MATDDLEEVEKLIEADDAEPAKLDPFGAEGPETPAQAKAQDEKLSRRQKAEAARVAKETELNERFARLDSQIGMSSQQIAQLREENARLQGALQYQQTVVTQRPTPQGPSWEDLRRDADKALDAKDYTEFRRLDGLATQALVDARTAAALEQFRQTLPDPRQFQQQAPQGVPPELQRAIDRNLTRAPKLAELPEPQMVARINAECGVLLAEGHQPGPALFAKAVDNCESRITGKSTRATFARGNGIQMDRHVNTGGGGGDEETGTAEQRAMWKKAGLPDDEFKKYA